MKIEKKHNHDHFWISGEILFETYQTIRGLRYLPKHNVPGMPDTDFVTNEMIIEIEKKLTEEEYICIECKRYMDEMEHNYGTPEYPCCIQCYNAAQLI